MKDFLQSYQRMTGDLLQVCEFGSCVCKHEELLLFMYRDLHVLTDLKIRKRTDGRYEKLKHW